MIIIGNLQIDIAVYEQVLAPLQIVLNLKQKKKQTSKNSSNSAASLKLPVHSNLM